MHPRNFVAALLMVVATVAQAAAQSPLARPEPRPGIAPVSSPLAARLTAPFSSAVVSKPLRESLTQIASISQVNLWIDRRVDPSLAVTIPAGPKSVFQAIADAAQSVGLDAVAAGNVVLVGRPDWVTTLAGAIFALPDEASQATAATTIQWPELTTPNQAINIVAGSDGPDTLALPHDLWPAVSWTDVSPQLAMLLITAQFDLMPIDPIRSSRGVKPLRAPETLVIAYPNGPHVPQMRQSALTADPQSRFRVGRPGAPLELTGSPAAHAAAAAAYFSHASSKVNQPPDLDSTRFSLRLRDAPARDVFAQLAATAGRQLEITQAAAQACDGRVTFEGRDVTLRELVQRVASELGVTATWTPAALHVDQVD